MNLKNIIATSVPYILPAGVCAKVYSESWQKQHISVGLRNQADALTIKSIPLPYAEMRFELTNSLPTPLHVHGVSVEIWLGKPVVQFTNFLSEIFSAGERRESLRAYTFLNQYQYELLTPSTKTPVPPNVAINLTIHGRSLYGAIDKTVKTTWQVAKSG